MSCTFGMLLCLDREQRLIYVLGEILAVTDTVGAELLVFRQHPFYTAPDLVQALRQIIDSPEFKRVTDAS